MVQVATIHEAFACDDRYESLKAAKLTEIKAGEDQKDTKTQELADTDEKNAQVQLETSPNREITFCITRT